jgi:8-oxo-dGTP diphosphatase
MRLTGARSDAGPVVSAVLWRDEVARLPNDKTMSQPHTDEASGRPHLIRIAVAVVMGPDGRTLVVRKRGSDIFMQPGGKIDSGESALAALVRELREELALVVAPNGCLPLGRFRAPAANEADAMVEADAFIVHLGASATATLEVQAELAELRWIDPVTPGEIRLAALSRDHILPAWLLSRG